MKLYSWLVLLSSIAAISCSTINEASKEQMRSDVYKVKNLPEPYYYAVVEEDSIVLHPAEKIKNKWIADTSSAKAIYLNGKKNDGDRKPVIFIKRKPTFDVISIVFKYRPSTEGFPNQLLTNFNAAAFAGYHTDRYSLSYAKNPMNSYQRSMNLFGYSFGVFAGLGAPEITPSVTKEQVEIEYYGLIIIKGVTGMVNFGSFKFGLAFGFDHLMDKNRHFWIYQGKPWLGVTAGINL